MDYSPARTMTTVGHALTGVSLAVVSLPFGRTVLWYIWAGHVYIALANLPDYPFPYWGHSRYDISHSIFVNLVLAAVFVSVIYMWRSLWKELGARVVGMYVVAWMSHFLLDSLYNHGRGVAIYWPFSEATLNLAIPIFSTLRPNPIFSDHNGRVFLIELAVYGTILFLCVAIRRWVVARKTI